MYDQQRVLNPYEVIAICGAAEATTVQCDACKRWVSPDDALPIGDESFNLCGKCLPDTSPVWAVVEAAESLHQNRQREMQRIINTRK